jgi:beta-lactamase class A
MSCRLIFSVALFSVIGISTPAFCNEQGSSVSAQLAQLEASSGGRLGVAAINRGNNQQIQYRANESFPMGCTSKVIGVAAILKKSMTDNQLLQETIQYKKSDLTNWTPITEKHLANGMTIAELCAAAISYSDNTAMNLLTKELGGPAGINAFARSINDKHFKLDHWWPDEALASPASGEDATTPAAMEKSLRKLVFGDVLAAPQREMLITWLKNNVTGNERIRAGVPKGWTVGDKTGTGFNYGTTNDIAVIWPPKCHPIVVAMYYSNNDKKAPKRNDVIASATRIVMDAYAQSDTCIKQQYSLGEHQERGQVSP